MRIFLRADCVEYYTKDFYQGQFILCVRFPEKIGGDLPGVHYIRDVADADSLISSLVHWDLPKLLELMPTLVLLYCQHFLLLWVLFTCH